MFCMKNSINQTTTWINWRPNEFNDVQNLPDSVSSCGPRSFSAYERCDVFTEKRICFSENLKEHFSSTVTGTKDNIIAYIFGIFHWFASFLGIFLSIFGRFFVIFYAFVPAKNSLWLMRHQTFPFPDLEISIYRWKGWIPFNARISQSKICWNLNIRIELSMVHLPLYDRHNDDSLLYSISYTERSNYLK